MIGGDQMDDKKNHETAKQVSLVPIFLAGVEARLKDCLKELELINENVAKLIKIVGDTYGP